METMKEGREVINIGDERLKANMKWTDMRTNKSVFEEVEMEQGDLVRKSEMPEPTRTTLTMTLRSQRGKLQD